jgi:flavin-dependent dehydrogenase
MVVAQGVTFLQDKVISVETDGRRVAAVNTQLGNRISSPWFIDASGAAASFFARAFRLPAYESGPRKVAIWGYFPITTPSEGTTLYADGVKPPYMEWVWEIPTNPNTISVGYVAIGETIKAQRQEGQTVEEILREKLGRFPRFASLLESVPAISPSVTSFVCRMHGAVAGPNWLIAGEAAAMVDPMTSNGVTAALRHASEASRLIVESRHRHKIPYLAAAMYSRRTLGLAKFFNRGIERVIYESCCRQARYTRCRRGASTQSIHASGRTEPSRHSCLAACWICRAWANTCFTSFASGCNPLREPWPRKAQPQG